MIVQRLDHVNIITDRLAETARFYAELLDLEERDGPPPLPPSQVRWMYDAGGQAILHLNSIDCPRAFDRDVAPGAETGAIHHVALRCAEFDEVKTRLDARGAEYPAEHNVGHLYVAKPALAGFYRKLDPTNTFNPGIGHTPRGRNWQECNHASGGWPKGYSENA